MVAVQHQPLECLLVCMLKSLSARKAVKAAKASASCPYVLCAPARYIMPACALSAVLHVCLLRKSRERLPVPCMQHLTCTLLCSNQQGSLEAQV